jgi:hypothetical protein
MGFDVVLGGVLCMVDGVDRMAVSKVGMVTSRFMVPIEMMLGGFAVVARSVLVMFRCLGVVMCCFVGHNNSSRGAGSLHGHARIIVRGGCGLGYRLANSV